MSQRQSRGRRGTAPGRLRIVAGNWRGRRLPVIDAEGLRPTSERVRETLFNWLMHWLPGKRCADLFAGTGALGLEALSREAKSCVFVESNRRVADALQENIATLSATGASVRCGDAERILADLPAGSIDLVFLDPPFASADMSDLCHRLNESGILAPGARVYIEQDKSAPEVSLPDDWRIDKQSKAGNVRYALVATADGNR
jgi:16S rRNA (guanine966-N2)-methyltransferase